MRAKFRNISFLPFEMNLDKSPLPISVSLFIFPVHSIFLHIPIDLKKKKNANLSHRRTALNINRFLTFHLNGGLEFRQLTGITRRDADLAEVDTRFPSSTLPPPSQRCRELIKNRAISHAGYNENIIEYLRKTRGSIIFSVD